ncbi:MAG: peptidoglycan-associated lipoprotein Pal [Betaproteobacteria bacterium]|nr:peptidoglycan-associated lipoprotein Pal [Betaproteobacteria bacterium]
MKKLILMVVACLVLTACSSPVKKAEESQPMQPAQVAKPVPAAATPVVQTESEAVKQARLIQELSKKSVYFDYDDFIIKPQYQDVILQQAEFIKKTNKDKVMLEGNADERGSTEYNLALGQKRAEAVRKALVIMGVPDSRLEAISYGEEKPRATCHEDKCWQENRRVDFVHKVK